MPTDSDSSDSLQQEDQDSADCSDIELPEQSRPSQSLCDSDAAKSSACSGQDEDETGPSTQRHFKNARQPQSQPDNDAAEYSTVLSADDHSLKLDQGAQAQGQSSRSQGINPGERKPLHARKLAS